jgi:hypothetical protein
MQSSHHLKTVTDPFSETSGFLIFTIPDDLQVHILSKFECYNPSAETYIV